MHNKKPRQQVFTRVVGTRIKPVIVEQVHWNVVFSQKVQELRVEVHLSKHKKRVNVIDRDHSPATGIQLAIIYRIERKALQLVGLKIE